MLELQYADDAALPSHTTTGLQRNLDVLADAYRRAGLNVNTKKTEILSCTVPLKLIRLFQRLEM